MSDCKRCQDGEGFHPTSEGKVCDSCLNDPETVHLGTVEDWTYLEQSERLQLSTSEGATVRLSISDQDLVSHLGQEWMGEQVVDLGDQWELPDREGRRFYHE